MDKGEKNISGLVLKAAERARKHSLPETPPAWTGRVKWPVTCTVGPGLEGAIACETTVSYINGAQGTMIYQGYDLYDLCAHSNYEEVCYLLLYGKLPNQQQLGIFSSRLVEARNMSDTLRMLGNFPLEKMHPMASLRLATTFMRYGLTWRDSEAARPRPEDAIAADEDSIPMETKPFGEKRAIYEFPRKRSEPPPNVGMVRDDAASMASCVHLISGLATLTAAIARMREGKQPIDPDPTLGHTANFLYMMTGQRPTLEEERVMDICLILHAEHGMNASTFASMVVASTLSDVYLAIGSGIAALSGPLHGGANEQVLRTLQEIGSEDRVEAWYRKAVKDKRRIPGFGHRVYKTYDPRAVILSPLAQHLARGNKEVAPILRIAKKLEKCVVSTLGKEKGIFPNVDYYSGIVYTCLGIPVEMFTPIFAVSRVAGWTARVMEYMRNNRIFRPRSMYIGERGKVYAPIGERTD
jgi:citrate synthase